MPSAARKTQRGLTIERRRAAPKALAPPRGEVAKRQGGSTLSAAGPRPSQSRANLQWLARRREAVFLPDTPTTEIYTLPLHHTLPTSLPARVFRITLATGAREPW